MKIRPVGADFFHADGRTGMTKLIIAFRNFCERAYYCLLIYLALTAEMDPLMNSVECR